MITCNLMGGLGNQIFQIFATISYAIKSRNQFKFTDKTQLGGGSTTMCIANDVVHLLFAAGSHTSVALNAGIEVNGHGRMRDITRRLFTPQGL